MVYAEGVHNDLRGIHGVECVVDKPQEMDIPKDNSKFLSQERRFIVMTARKTDESINVIIFLNSKGYRLFGTANVRGFNRVLNESAFEKEFTWQAMINMSIRIEIIVASSILGF
jgi:hypothetical protein